MSNVHNILNDMAFSCDCGGVNFNLLKSSLVECSGCQKKMSLVWSDMDKDMMRNIAIIESGEGSKPIVKSVWKSAQKILDHIERVRDLDDYSQSELAYEILIRSGDL